MGDGCRSSLVQDLLELRLDCSSDLANSSDVGSDLSTLADLQSGHPNSVSRKHRVALLSMVESSRALKRLLAIGTICVLTSCHPWIPATDKDAFRPCSCSVDTSDLSTKEIEDPVLYIASTLRLWFPYTRFIRTTVSLPCVIINATAVVASEAPVVASFFEKSLWKS